MVSPNLFLPKGDTTTTNQVLNLFNAVQQQKQQQAQAAQQQIENQFRQQQIAIQQGQAETQGGNLILNQIKAEQARKAAEAQIAKQSTDQAIALGKLGISGEEAKTKRGTLELSQERFRVEQDRQAAIDEASGLLNRAGQIFRSIPDPEQRGLFRTSIEDFAGDVLELDPTNAFAASVIKRIDEGAADESLTEIFDLISDPQERERARIAAGLSAQDIPAATLQLTGFGAGTRLGFEKEREIQKAEINELIADRDAIGAINGIAKSFDFITKDIGESPQKALKQLKEAIVSAQQIAPEGVDVADEIARQTGFRDIKGVFGTKAFGKVSEEFVPGQPVERPALRGEQKQATTPAGNTVTAEQFNRLADDPELRKKQEERTGVPFGDLRIAP